MNPSAPRFRHFELNVSRHIESTFVALGIVMKNLCDNHLWEKKLIFSDVSRLFSVCTNAQK